MSSLDLFGYLSILKRIEGKVNHMAGELDDLKAKVATVVAGITAAIAVMDGIKAALDQMVANGGADGAVLKELADQLEAARADLAQHTAADTLALPVT